MPTFGSMMNPPNVRYRIGGEVYDTAAMLDAVQDGYCSACEALHESSVEPDARDYLCAECGEPKVASIVELALMQHPMVEVLEGDEDEE